MELLKERIREEGIVLNNRVLKVDGFLNHQIDPQLFKAIGKEIADRYRDAGVQRIVTIEASGIALALMAALELDVPLVFARKKKSILMVDDVYHSVVYSYTKEENYDITISKKFDDFLASGEAAMGLAKLVQDAGDEVVGMAIAIEKSFQPGRERLENAGYRVESLVRIKEFKDNGCVFIED
ncbi:MAG: xanthine phosphoribosyltransferase [Veillonella sp.]|nr:xanthine phosphoribosyltransferase [Veillonella sp.]